jgi:hypothetical protein
MSEDNDEKADQTGTLFVDILFALVVTEVLSPLKTPENITGPGAAHLCVAFVLTILSWVGYHNSGSRADARIRFPIRKRSSPRLHPANDWEYFAFQQFALDVMMVIVYWWSAITFESSTSPTMRANHWFWPTHPSAVPEALATVISFILYAVWDWVGRREVRHKLDDDQLSGSHREALERKKERREARQWPTYKCGGTAAGFLVIALLWSDAAGVYIIDVLLVALLVAYRYRKEAVVAHLADD